MSEGIPKEVKEELVENGKMLMATEPDDFNRLVAIASKVLQIANAWHRSESAS